MFHQAFDANVLKDFFLDKIVIVVKFKYYTSVSCLM